MARLDKDRQKKLEPLRMNFAIDEITKLGYKIVVETNTVVSFVFKGNVIHFYPYSGWHTGKGIKDGRGWKKLYEQIKPENGTDNK